MAIYSNAQLVDLAADLEEMRTRLDEDLYAAVNVATREFKLDIQGNLIDTGLSTNENDTKPNQPDLSDSFTFKRPSRGRWMITSDAPHANAHEKGTRGGSDITIKPEDGELLSWVPENPSDYPTPDEVLQSTDEGYVYQDAENVTWYDPEEGRVFSTGVEHPGVEPSKYIFRASAKYEYKLSVRLRNISALAIMNSGFKPSA